MLPVSKIRQIRRSLLRWYEKNRRDLPWRHTSDPYAIWIAETMLQQTQVKTVLKYYRRFLAALPNLESLDCARKDKVLALWSGLGYYRRAENLKAAARILASQYVGKLPSDYDDLLGLPGVGSYTAGALMSIAFKQRYPALDGNAKRVISRLMNLRRESRISETAGQIVPRTQPGDFNQALMDLGSDLCHPKNPNCSQCPLSKCCLARTLGRSLSPQRPKLHTPTNLEWPMIIIHKDGRILLHRRSQDGLLRGLWELPGGQRREKENVMATLIRHLRSLDRNTHGILKIGEVRHSMTRYKIRSPIFLCSQFKSPRSRDSSWRWVPTASLERFPLSSLSLKAVRLFSEHSEFPILD